MSEAAEKEAMDITVADLPMEFRVSSSFGYLPTYLVYLSAHFPHYVERNKVKREKF